MNNAGRANLCCVVIGAKAEADAINTSGRAIFMVEGELLRLELEEALGALEKGLAAIN
jgi:hypothetical protein